MAFGKLGRPSDDRLARQREIYQAVSPLILDMGVHYLSMRVAARAACLSVGGLYHHFSTKRDLVLHGIQSEAIVRYCQDFHDQFGYLADSDPAAFLDAYLNFVTDAIGFIRPALHAALEMGVETLENVLEPSLTAATDEFTATFRTVFPGASEEIVYRAGRAINRAIVSALFDRNLTAQEFRGEVSALINGYLVMRTSTSTMIINSLPSSEKY
ncbi:MAG: TetR/AcrR family transcriptional regulator [Chloroflexi bacterium]|nr:TetR/AcrR family transcriptional regulator [Chloroflexota bacterium]